MLSSVLCSCGSKKERLLDRIFSLDFDTAHEALTNYVDAGYSLEEREPVFRNTILHHAAQRGWPSEVETLLKKGVSPNVTNSAGETALMLGVKSTRPVQVTKLLLDADVNLNITDRDGKSALHHAIGNADALVMLVKNGAGIDLPDKTGRTPLLQSSYQCYYGTMQILITLGANVNAQDSSGDTPLNGCLNTCNEFGVNLLLENGANVSVTNKKNLTALGVAETKGCLDIAKKLRSRLEPHIPK